MDTDRPGQASDLKGKQCRLPGGQQHFEGAGFGDIVARALFRGTDRATV